jgi:hypothetical protein
MKITALYKPLEHIAVLTFCIKDDWRSCQEHENCQPVAITIPFRRVSVKIEETVEVYDTPVVAKGRNKNISAVSLKNGEFY